MQSEQQQEPVTVLVNQTLGFFVGEYHADNVAFPVLPSTYALWRKYAYQQLILTDAYKQAPQQAHFHFYLQSECHYLPTFLAKVTQKLEHSPASNLTPSTPPSMQVNEKILQDYNKALEMHTLYQELIQDIVALPYLQTLFPSQKYQLREDLCPELVSLQAQGQLVTEKMSNTLVNKGFGIIAEKLFTKTFIIQASSLAIRLNPLCMVASFAFGQLLSNYRSGKKSEQLEQKLNEALCRTQEKAQALKTAYEECIGLLGPALREGGIAMNVFIAKMKELVVEDWLSIEKTQDDDGWEVVQLHQNNKLG